MAWPGLVMAWPGIVRPGLAAAWLGLVIAWPGHTGRPTWMGRGLLCPKPKFFTYFQMIPHFPGKLGTGQLHAICHINGSAYFVLLSGQENGIHHGMVL